MDPVTMLIAEHNLISRMQFAMDSELERIKERLTVDLFFIDDTIDFIKTYVRGCHQGKEEILFDRLSLKKIRHEHCCSIEQLRKEHIYENNMVARLSVANEEYSRGFTDEIDDVYQCLEKLTSFLPFHSKNEEEGLFKNCLDYFTVRQAQVMVKDFWEFDRKLIHQKYRDIVERLESKT